MADDPAGLNAIVEKMMSIVEYDIIPMLREYWFDNDNLFDQETQKLRNALK